MASKQSVVTFVVLLVCHPVVSLGQEPKSALPSADIQNAAYGPHERHTLDLWQAAGDGPRPLLVFIHGGGWAGGDKSALPPALLNTMRGRGVSVASINYRYTSQAKLPGPLHDAARSIQYLRSRSSDWNLNPQRVAAYGISAGGCSALWLAYHDDLADPQAADPIARQSTRLQAAVGLSPQTSLEPDVVVAWLGPEVLNHPMIARAVGAKNGEEVLSNLDQWRDVLRAGSPLTHVTRDDPPTLLSFPTAAALPALNAGQAIHHALFGRKLHARASAVGARCDVRIEDQMPPLPKPDEFLLEVLFAPR